MALTSKYKEMIIRYEQQINCTIGHSRHDCACLRQHALAMIITHAFLYELTRSFDARPRKDTQK